MKPNSEGIKTILKDLIDRGKNKGALSYKEIIYSLEEVELEPEQIEKIFENLESMGIEVLGDESEDDDIPEPEVLKDDIILTEEDLDISVPDGISIDDPVRMT